MGKVINAFDTDESTSTMASNVMREEIFTAASDVVAVIRNLQASAEKFGTDNDEAIVKRLVEVLEGFSTALPETSHLFHEVGDDAPWTLDSSSSSSSSNSNSSNNSNSSSRDVERVNKRSRQLALSESEEDFPPKRFFRCSTPQVETDDSSLPSLPWQHDTPSRSK